jgi:hypothetical protein
VSVKHPHLIKFLVGLGVVLFAQCGVTRRSEIYLIPKGFTGWVRIEYGVYGAPTLSEEGRRYLVRVPNQGYVRTSTKFEEGWAIDQFLYVDGQGNRERLALGELDKHTGSIWGIATGFDQSHSNKGPIYRTFFVGSETLFLKNPSPNNRGAESR